MGDAAALLALLAALCWAVTGVISAPAVQHMGAFAFTRWRMLFAATMLWALVAVQGHSLHWTALDLFLLSLSGLLGIFVGDTAMFACLRRLGPRRTGLLYATHSIFTLLLSALLLHERIWGWGLLGSVLVIAGVMLAVAKGRRPEANVHAWEQTHGRLWIGVSLGLLAALCQAGATLLIKPLMASGADAIGASAVRTSVAYGAHMLLWASGWPMARALQPATGPILLRTAATGLIGMVMGMTLVLQALKSVPANIVGVLSSVTPVLILPILWMVYRHRPAHAAWIAAFLVVMGTTLILTR